MVMRIALGEVSGGAGDKEVKTNVAASGKGRVNVVRFVVLLRCMMTGVGCGEMRLRLESSSVARIQSGV
jgi:hypothetical protein